MAPVTVTTAHAAIGLGERPENRPSARAVRAGNGGAVVLRDPRLGERLPRSEVLPASHERPAKVTAALVGGPDGARRVAGHPALTRLVACRWPMLLRGAAAGPARGPALVAHGRGRLASRRCPEQRHAPTRTLRALGHHGPTGGGGGWPVPGPEPTPGSRLASLAQTPGGRGRTNPSVQPGAGPSAGTVDRRRRPVAGGGR